MLNVDLCFLSKVFKGDLKTHVVSRETWTSPVPSWLSSVPWSRRPPEIKPPLESASPSTRSISPSCFLSAHKINNSPRGGPEADTLESAPVSLLCFRVYRGLSRDRPACHVNATSTGLYVDTADVFLNFLFISVLFCQNKTLLWISSLDRLEVNYFCLKVKSCWMKKGKIHSKT